MPKDIPSIIALCGNPNSGKSTAAKILSEELGFIPVDDGGPLRDISIKYLGLNEHQCYTQEGKEQFVDINGRRWQCREVLGELGNCFEDKFGANIIPIMSYHNIIKPGIAEGKRFSLGSCRRDQGYYWSSIGGLVIEILNPDSPASKFEFDRYDKSSVNLTVVNDGLSKGLSEEDAISDFRQKLLNSITSYGK